MMVEKKLLRKKFLGNVRKFVRKELAIMIIFSLKTQKL